MELSRLSNEPETISMLSATVATKKRIDASQEKNRKSIPISTYGQAGAPVRSVASYVPAKFDELDANPVRVRRVQ